MIPVGVERTREPASGCPLVRLQPGHPFPDLLVVRRHPRLPQHINDKPGPVDLETLSDDELQLLMVAVPHELERRKCKREAELLAFIREQIGVGGISLARLRVALFRGATMRRRDGASKIGRAHV